MSDINEEQKRLYKRAEEFDKKYNKYLQKELAETKNELKGYIDNFKDNTYQLKGIITHEQIESMEYKVKE